MTVAKFETILIYNLCIYTYVYIYATSDVASVQQCWFSVQSVLLFIEMATLILMLKPIYS